MLAAPIDCLRTVGARIARIEGWANPKSLVRRFHNPGALRTRSGRYARYRSDDAGWQALYADLRAKTARGLSWPKIIDVWSEQPDAYRRAFSGVCGVQ